MVEGLKTEHKMETTISGQSGNKSYTVDSVRMFDSETPIQLEANRKKEQRKRGQHRNNKGAEKSHTREQANRKGRGVRNQTFFFLVYCYPVEPVVSVQLPHDVFFYSFYAHGFAL